MVGSRFLGTIRIHDHGGSGPPILLIHGLGGSLQNWSGVAGPLSTHSRTVALDLPGFGLSGPAHHHDLDEHVGAVFRAIEYLDAPATLVGNSMGGLVAMLATRARPDLIDAMVLVDPAAPLPGRTPPPNLAMAVRILAQSLPGTGPALAGLYRHMLTPRRQVEMALGSITARFESIAPSVIDEAVDLATTRRNFPWASRAFIESAASTRRWVLRPARYHSMFETIETPTLLMWGDRDPLVSPAAMEALSRRHPDWDTKVFSGVGHVPQIEAPESFTTAVVEWLSRVENFGR